MKSNTNLTNNNTHNLHPSILRAYDVRGVVDKTISAKDLEFIGKAFGSYITRKTEGKTIKVCVAFDGRHSSPIFEEELVKGLLSTGIDVIRIGRGPTPMLYFAVKHLQAQAGIMITGSHNPPSHNGCKMLFGKLPLKDEEIQELGKICINGDFVYGSGSVEFADIFDEYVASLKNAFNSKKSLKIAWDAGNGASGEAMKALSEILPGEHILLNQEINGDFPSHHPDPSVPENMEQLKQAVLTNNCDIGIAFDGDGDRIGVIDNKGRMLMGDQLMFLLAEDILKQNPGATIIADVKSSQVLFNHIEKLGGKALMWKTGHSLIKYKMLETSAELAGEVSGHIFYKANNGFDDGLYAAIRLINFLSNSNESLAQKFDRMPKTFSTDEHRIDVTEERKFRIIEEIKEYLATDNNNNSPIQVNTLDGIRVTTPDGWWLLRASNTQAALVARCEAESASSLKILEQQLNGYLERSGVCL